MKDAAWVLLTQGDRRVQLAAAIASVRDAPIVVVVNAAPGAQIEAAQALIIEPGRNLGVPGGRALGIEATEADVVFFLDDDALVMSPDLQARILEQFENDPRLAAVSFRIVDEHGITASRHVPRLGAGSGHDSGEVVAFLGGACALRRTAYDEVGGYFPDLFYAHEELDLAWRLHDAGWTVRYDAEAEVFHPNAPIGRHPDGWRLTGRNRVWIARRSLPWPVLVVHVTVWLMLGALRAPRGECRRSYVAGWGSGWREPADRHPIRWHTVWKLAKLGRPPVV